MISRKACLYLAVASLVGCGGDGGDPADLPANQSPVISGPSVITVKENSKDVVLLEVSDADGNPFTLSLKGDDSKSLTISQDGQIRFAIPADYENPSDIDGNNEYEITVVASDTYSKNTEKKITIVVEDVEGDTIENISQHVTTFDDTFDPTVIINSFEYPVLLQSDNQYELTGVFADVTLAQAGWNNLESLPETARIGEASVSTCEITGVAGECDSPQGSITIKGIDVTSDYLAMLMSGGNGSNNVGLEVRLSADGSVLAQYTPNSCGDPVLKGDQHYISVDVGGLIGSQVDVVIYDNESGGCGFIAFDHLYQTNQSPGEIVATANNPLKPTGVTLPDDAMTGLIPGASFEAPEAMIERRGWVATGAFQNATLNSWEGVTASPDAARVGERAISTCEMNNNSSGCDLPVGTLTSAAFLVTKDYLNLLLAGGNGTAPVGVALLDTSGNVLHSYSPASCGPAFIDGDDDWTWLNVAALKDAYVKFQLFDNEPGGCGFVSVDHLFQSDSKWNPANTTNDAGTVALSPNQISGLGFGVLLQDDAFTQVIGDFDDATVSTWVPTGDFAHPANADAWIGTSGVARVGHRAVSTCAMNNDALGCDAPVGSLTSPEFAVSPQRPHLRFLMAGGNGSAPVGLRVLDASGNVLETYTPDSCGASFINGNDDWVVMDLSDYVGSHVKIQMFDEEPGGCGFLSFDHVHMSAHGQ